MTPETGVQGASDGQAGVGPGACGARRVGTRALVVVNAGLIVALGVMTVGERVAGLVASGAGTLVDSALGSSAEAQPRAGQARARGTYTLLGGDITAGSENAVYVIDSGNAEMIAVRLVNQNKLEGLGYRDLDEDAGEQRVGR